MVFQNAFKKLELEQTAHLLEEVNPYLEGSSFDPVSTTLMAIDVSFYPGYQFFDISDYNVSPTLRRFVLFKAPQGKEMAKVVVLNWTNEPIYMLNHTCPISLNTENVCEYARFFFNYIKGKHGRFIMAENVDDIAWKDEPPPQARKAISRMVMPITLNEEKDGNYYCQATMMFRDCLFKADIEVKPNGLVTLSNEELLVEDIPVLDDLFAQ